ncbi:MAG: hypothetical protein ACI8P9_003390 [Parasphingorhabdus sp.]|jgi:hypothetical protein
MQQFSMSAHVEISAVTTVEDVAGMSQTAGFLIAVDRIARSLSAIPHWGQRYSLRDAEVRRLYGNIIIDGEELCVESMGLENSAIHLVVISLEKGGGKAGKKGGSIFFP